MLVVTVLTDLPSHGSRATDIASANTVIRDVNSDMTSCIYAVQESFIINQDQSKGSLTPADKARIPSLLSDDQMACSLTNQSVFDLSEIDVPGSTGGKQLAQVVDTATLWATSDALGAIEAIQTLSGDPHDASARAALAKDEALLAKDRSNGQAEVAAVESMLGTRLVPLSLPPLPSH